MLGPEHPDTLESINNLAKTYSDQGKHSEAEELQIHVLETRKRVLGPEHPDTLSSNNNLAGTYSHQGKYSEAEDLRIHVVEAVTIRHTLLQTT